MAAHAASRPGDDAVQAAFDLMWLQIADGALNEGARSAARIMSLTHDPVLLARAEAALGTMFLRVGQLADSRIRFRRATSIAVDDGARATYSALGAMARFYGGDLPSAQSHAEDAMVLGEATGNTHAMCEALNTLSAVHHANGDPARALALARRAVGLAEVENRSRGGRPMPELFLAAALIDLDRLREADRELTTGLAVARQRPVPDVEVAWFLAFRVTCRFISGMWDQALEDAREAIRAAEASGTLVVLPLVWGVTAFIQYFRGDDSAARELVAASGPHRIGGFGSFASDWLIYAQSIVTSDSATSYELMQEAWHHNRDLPFFLSWRIASPNMVRAALQFDDRAFATTITEEARRGVAAAGELASARATLDRCEGLLLADPERLTAATDGYTDAGRPLSVGHAAMDAARAWIRAGESEKALQQLLIAGDAFDELGATRSMAMVGRLLARQRSAPAPVLAPRPDPLARLTRAERAVAALVAEGLTNPEVAERLTLSARTVQSHLSHVYTKLGISSRVQLATMVSQME